MLNSNLTKYIYKKYMLNLALNDWMNRQQPLPVR